jgi:hypothetical protein
MSGAGGSAGSAGGSGWPEVACDYSEVDDVSNAASEPTSLYVDGLQILCGQIDPGHLAGNDLVDKDGFVVSIPSAGDYVIKVALPGSAALSNVILEFLGSKVPFSNGRAVLGKRVPLGGSYVFAIHAFNPNGIASAIPYKVSLIRDTHCPKALAAADYLEANDGATNTGNDVFLLDGLSGTQSFTASTMDAPEATGLTVQAGSKQRLSGLSADVSQALASTYKDGDTFSFQTGALTTQVTVRVDWPGGTADLDYALFPAGSTSPSFFSRDTNSSLELSVFAVQPNTSYWLWLGAKGSSSGLPTGYDVSVCGDSFAFTP